MRIKGLARQASRPAPGRYFGYGLGVCLLFLGLAPVLAGGGLRLWALGLGATVVAIAIARPRLLGRPRRLAARCGGWAWRVIGPVLAPLIYLLLVTPVAICRRRFGRSPIIRGFAPEQASYWQTGREGSPVPARR